MNFTTYQPPEIYDVNGDLIRSGAFGPETPFYDGAGMGMYDYIVNNLEALYNGVGGAAQNASNAQTAANQAVAKANEASGILSSVTTLASQAVAAKEAAILAKEAAEAARDSATAITTPEGLAARVVALEALPHYYYDNNGHLMFHYGV